MIFILNKQPSIANQFIAELRDVKIQRDRMRFRTNLERVGQILGYELSKNLDYKHVEVETPLGVAPTQLPAQSVVLATILRAGLPLHNGLLQYFDGADNAFISAYRRHRKSGKFDIEVEYTSCPSIEDKVLILSDPMLASGSSMVLAAQSLMKYGTPSKLHIVTAIAAEEGVENVRRNLPDADIWIGAMDAELTAKSYIVPGLGDAGDLAFGTKLQQ